MTTLASGNFVSYIRVSTAKQGASGLGLEAQRAAVTSHLNGGSWELLAEFVEVETGKGSNAIAKRPQLAAALAMAKKHKATLCIAKLDRLARNVHFVSGLMESGVKFVACDMPNADAFQLHLFAALAEKEAKVISERTKAALAAAKARGVRLGAHGAMLATQRAAAAREALAPISRDLQAMQAEGLSVRKIAERLNAEGVASPGGGKWHVSSVHKALARIAEA